jgi:hypothetical protein
LTIFPTRQPGLKVAEAPQWLLAPNEGHGFYDTHNRTLFYEKLEAFLGKAYRIKIN